MKNIHLNRAGNSLGQFTLEEVREGLASGQFLPTDLVWRPGMPEWKALSDFEDLGAASVSQGESFLAQNAINPEPVGGLGPSWENRAELGTVKALLATVREVLMEPAETFANMKRIGGLGTPLVFYLVWGIIAGIVNVGYQFIIELGTAASQEQLAESYGLPAFATGGLAIGITLFLVPIMVAVGIFIYSAILHLCLMIVGAQPDNFESTFRTCCYASGATSVLQIIPICGGLVALVWNIVALGIGFSKVHDISVGKSTLAVLLPLIVCCAGALLLAMLVPAFAAGFTEAFQSAGP